MSKELELFSDYTEMQTMTVKEVAESMGVSIALITKTIRELFPDKMKKGKTTLLSESVVTAISIRIKQNKHLMTSYDHTKLDITQSNLNKTELEKKLLIKQGYDLLMEEVETLR